ncbi:MULTISPECIES: PH domain-containing protein [Leuconostoc]|uniref:PH domain-containing protein n=1 Tax=Leuconostoc TaxID=1243 RepID=UPI0012385F1C|nr:MULTISPECIES: PH domain-containing protein [Leuconostoc]KAA8365703.1 hypothetical protein FE416_07375 [Leuconostoc carnosum]KAA8373646.1 hypothetical protein FE412_01660 [Leuconostoc carnosum]KAA8377151.1 hypothetical protein FE405_07555 [Leuconostoc carnosum]MBZ5943952.1 PH domain-containing protein [Leuconostoc gasicomitatum]MBZ5973062.1 PH domain-containing protein [Leuconostoc gasicomitatum]
MTKDNYETDNRLEQIKTQFTAAGVSDLFGTKKEVKALPELLSADEIVLYATSGFVSKGTVLVVVTDQRLLFINKGLIYGTDFKEIPFKHINAVSYSKGLVFAKVSITNGANVTLIEQVSKDNAPTFVQKLKYAIEQQENASTHVMVKNTNDNSINNLRNLKQLLDDGIITQDDFDAKKKQILGI